MNRQAAIIAKIRDLLDELESDAPTVAQITPYSQNDPRWGHKVYASDYTFARAGCYVTAVAMIASLAYYTDDPPAVAAKLRAADCFNGAMLSYPAKIPDAFQRLEWSWGAYYNRPGKLMQPPRMDKIRAHLDEYGALILKVDYKPDNYLYNMHFVVAVAHAPGDFEIIDPLDGVRVSLLERYGVTRGWTAAQAVFGYRALRVRR